MSLQVRRSDLSGAFWLYNPGIESISDVIYFFFFCLIQTLPFPLICLFSVHLVVFVISKLLLCRKAELPVQFKEFLSDITGSTIWSRVSDKTAKEF